MRTCAMRHVAQPCELPHGAFEHTILVTHTSCATPATTRAKAKGGSYVTPSPPTKRSEEPRGTPYHHRYAARHRSTPTCQFWARMNSAAALARFPFDVSRRQMASPIKGYHTQVRLLIIFCDSLILGQMEKGNRTDPATVAKITVILDARRCPPRRPQRHQPPHRHAR